jgi:hypothetical protein
MEKPVDAHAFILTNEGFFRSKGWIGQRQGVVNRLILFLSQLGQPQVFRYGAEPAFQAAPALKLIQGAERLEKGFLRDLFGRLRTSGKGERITVYRVEIALIDLIKSIGLHCFPSPFHFIGRGSRRNLTKKIEGAAFIMPPPLLYTISGASSIPVFA